MQVFQRFRLTNLSIKKRSKVHLFQVMLVCVLTVLSGLDAPCWAQLGGGGGPQTPILPEEDPSLLTAWMYSEFVASHELKVPEDWESRYEYSIQQPPVAPPNGRMYGAFAVANFNNTDSDDKVDCDGLFQNQNSTLEDYSVERNRAPRVSFRDAYSVS